MIRNPAFTYLFPFQPSIDVTLFTITTQDLLHICLGVGGGAGLPMGGPLDSSLFPFLCKTR